MKTWILFIALAFMPGLAKADIFSVSVTPASSNIPTSFSAASTSRVIQNISNVRAILVNNGTSSPVAVNCSYRGNFVPTNTDVHNIYVAAGGAVAIDQAYLAGTCYVRSMGSVINSGVFQLMLVGG